MWIIPSYNRAEKCKEVIDHINAVGCSSKGIVFVNGTEQLSEYEKINLPQDWKLEISDQNLGLCQPLNMMFNKYPDEAFYGLICDDELVFTPDWDKKLIMAAGKTRISHGNDHWQSKHRMHTYTTFGGDIIRQLGWWALPGLWHWYFDDVWEMIDIDFHLRRFVPEVKTEHKHYMAQKCEKDATYIEGEKNKEKDQIVFMNYVDKVYEKDKEILKKKFKYFGK